MPKGALSNATTQIKAESPHREMAIVPARSGTPHRVSSDKSSKQELLFLDQLDSETRGIGREDHVERTEAVCARLRSGVLPHEQESWTGKSVRLFVPRPAVPLNLESQMLSGKDNTKEKRERPELSRWKPSCRSFPTCSDAYRFGGSMLESHP